MSTRPLWKFAGAIVFTVALALAQTTPKSTPLPRPRAPISLINGTNTLRMNEVFPMGSWLRSKNGVFIATLQADGNFVIYRGTSISDAGGHGHLWATDKTGTGPFFMILQADGNLDIYHGTNPGNQGNDLWYSNKFTSNMSGPYVGLLQDDGNFVVYRGTSENDRTDVWWNTGQTDPLLGFDEIGKLTYNASKAKVVKQVPLQGAEQSVRNDSSSPQTSSVSLQWTTTNESSWSDSVSNSVTIHNSAEVSIPMIASDTLDVTYVASTADTKQGSVVTTQGASTTVSITVPPHSSGKVEVWVNQASISEPYSFTGTYLFQSGTRMPAKNVNGIYTGENAYNPQITFTAFDSQGKQLFRRPISAPITLGQKHESAKKHP
jgi:hypothetical protein